MHYCNYYSTLYNLIIIIILKHTVILLYIISKTVQKDHGKKLEKINETYFDNIYVMDMIFYLKEHFHYVYFILHI